MVVVTTHRTRVLRGFALWFVVGAAVVVAVLVPMLALRGSGGESPVRSEGRSPSPSASVGSVVVPEPVRRPHVESDSTPARRDPAVAQAERFPGCVRRSQGDVLLTEYGLRRDKESVVAWGVDILRVGLEHTQHDVIVRLALNCAGPPQLTDEDQFDVPIDVDGDDASERVLWWRAGNPKGRVYDDVDTDGTVFCTFPVFRRGEVVVLRAPASCLGSPRQLRTRAYMIGVRANADFGDVTQWTAPVRRGEDTSVSDRLVQP